MNTATDPRFAHRPDIAMLPDLWRRRMQLSHDEMASLYELVSHALHAYRPLELSALREDKAELVAQFIYSRVLRLEPDCAESHACPESAPSSVSAICAYFRRYLIDCLRSATHRLHVSMELEGIEQDASMRMYALDEPVESVLMQYALDESRVRHAARAFIAGLDEGDRIVLAGSLGWCSGRKGGLCGVAAAHRVRSYHYRAVKLGGTVRKNSTPEDFAQTKIGRWLSDALGIAISVENRAVILIVLNLLAGESNPVTSG